VLKKKYAYSIIYNLQTVFLTNVQKHRSTIHKNPQSVVNLHGETDYTQYV